MSSVFEILAKESGYTEGTPEWEELRKKVEALGINTQVVLPVTAKASTRNTYLSDIRDWGEANPSLKFQLAVAFQLWLDEKAGVPPNFSILNGPVKEFLSQYNKQYPALSGAMIQKVVKELTKKPRNRKPKEPESVAATKPLAKPKTTTKVEDFEFEV